MCKWVSVIRYFVETFFFTINISCCSNSVLYCESEICVLISSTYCDNIHWKKMSSSTKNSKMHPTSKKKSQSNQHQSKKVASKISNLIEIGDTNTSKQIHFYSSVWIQTIFFFTKVQESGHCRKSFKKDSGKWNFDPNQRSE